MCSIERKALAHGEGNILGSDVVLEIHEGLAGAIHCGKHAAGAGRWGVHADRSVPVSVGDRLRETECPAQAQPSGYVGCGAAGQMPGRWDRSAIRRGLARTDARWA